MGLREHSGVNTSQKLTKRLLISSARTVVFHSMGQMASPQHSIPWKGAEGNISPTPLQKHSQHYYQPHLTDREPEAWRH